MPLASTKDNAPTSFPEPDVLTLGKFDRGVITLIDKSHLPKNALEELTNGYLVEDGEPTIRPGTDWFGTVPFLPAPGVATLTITAGTNLGAGVYKYRVTFVNAQGETSGGTEASVTTSGGNKAVNLTAIPIGGGGTTARKIYRTTVGGTTEKLLTTLANNTTTTYSDTTADGSLGANYPTTNTALVGSIDGVDYFDFAGVVHLVCVADGGVYRSTDDATTWTLCTGATLTAGLEVGMNQYNAFLYLTNGTDAITRYDGSTTLQVYTTLTTPAAPTPVKTGLAGTTYTYYYKSSAVSAIGFSIASAKGTITVGTPRENWDNTSNFVTLTLDAPQATQTRSDIYISTDDINYYYLDSIVSSTGTPGVTYKDNGTAIVIPSTTAPIDNTTQGPTVAELVNVGSRMYGVRDPNHRYRIWFTSGTNPLGAFSSGYDGGYLDWQPGGKYTPVHVEDYRDGKGTPMATVWCDSADGQGCIIQMSLNTLTVGSLSVTVPSAYKLPGSRGTPAPHSVVNVLNNFFFYNTQAFYQLGSSPQLLQILSTNELSANIRPTVQTISHAAESSIASVYYYDKVYYSVPYNSTVNNFTAIFDTERRAWMPTAFTVGYKKFLKYTDTAKGHHLLALKPGDNRLTEISSSFQGDYGVAFETSLLTGLYQTEKNRFDFQYTQEMEFEFSNPQDTIYVELLGIDHAKGFISVKTVPLNVTSTVTDAGWDTFAADTAVWDDTSVVPTVVSESSVKRYATVQAELNAVQWHIYTTSLSAKYILRTLQTWGTNTQDAHPSKWRVQAI